jgi:hypothetical protein
MMPYTLFIKEITMEKIAATKHIEKKSGLALLRVPFAPNQISRMCRSTKKDNPKGKCNKCGGYHGLPAVSLDYVGHAALTDRLLDADPNWTWEPLAFGPNGLPAVDENDGMWIRLTVSGITRIGYGDAQNRTGGDGVKERIGDALRNAAMRFGAALDLWHKGDLHGTEDLPAAEHVEKPAAPKAVPAAGTISGEQVDQIKSLLAETGQSLQRVLAFFRVSALSEIKTSDFPRVVATLEKSKQRAA